jgi:hypothetical protein
LTARLRNRAVEKQLRDSDPLLLVWSRQPLHLHLHQEPNWRLRARARPPFKFKHAISAGRVCRPSRGAEQKRLEPCLRGVGGGAHVEAGAGGEVEGNAGRVDGGEEVQRGCGQGGDAGGFGPCEDHVCDAFSWGLKRGASVRGESGKVPGIVVASGSTMSPFQLHMSAVGEGAVFCSVEYHHDGFGTALPCDALARDAFGR